MHYLEIESWGYSLWKDRKQYGAGVGLSPWLFYKQPDTIAEKRILRKHGIAAIRAL